METNENEDTTVQNFWDTAKAVLRGKYKHPSKKLEKTQIHMLTSHLKELEKEQQSNPHQPEEGRNKNSSRTQ